MYNLNTPFPALYKPSHPRQNDCPGFHLQSPEVPSSNLSSLCQNSPKKSLPPKLNLTGLRCLAAPLATSSSSLESLQDVLRVTPFLIARRPPDHRLHFGNQNRPYHHHSISSPVSPHCLPCASHRVLHLPLLIPSFIATSPSLCRVTTVIFLPTTGHCRVVVPILLLSSQASHCDPHVVAEPMLISITVGPHCFAIAAVTRSYFFRQCHYRSHLIIVFTTPLPPRAPPCSWGFVFALV